VKNSPKYFDPETLAQIRPLSLRARTLIEGWLAGMHRSPLRGQSLEFSQHREYVPGDDMRQVDWKVFARSDKHYVRQYEDETTLTAMVLIDRSLSMDYRSQPQRLSKLDYASLIACSLVYLITSQQDSVGLATFSSQVDDWLRPSSQPAQLDTVIALLDQPIKQPRTSGLAMALHQCAQRLDKPHLIVVLSDWLDDIEHALQALKLLHCAGHDLLVMHLLDPWEVSFPFDQTCEFLGLEGNDSLVADPLLIAGAYRQAMADLCRQFQMGCLSINCDYYRLLTDQSLSVSLSNLLAHRLLRGNRK
jgi:uncharacterized protein (DUF58 family)